jgi:hypothetical protein
MRYAITTDRDEFRIFPRNKHGQTRPVRIVRIFIKLTEDTTKEEITFKRYLHRKQWYWGDSRVNGPVSDAHVIGEIARMAFGGDHGAAVTLMIKAMTS